LEEANMSTVTAIKPSYSPLDVTELTFAQEVLQSSTPVLVDFWGEGCAPCRTLAFILKDVGQRFEGRAKIAKVDIHSQPELANRYNIQALPTMLFFKGGEVVGQRVGVVSASAIGAQLEQIIG
jgi:thioredoxin 1